MKLFSLFVCAFFLSFSLALEAGVVEGKVVVEGKIPKLKPRAKKYSPYGAMYKEKEPAPGLEKPKHLLVYLEGVPGDFKPASKNPELAQKDRDFVEDIIPVIKGGKVDITNNDTVAHHIRCGTEPWKFNLKPKKPGEKDVRTFGAPQEAGANVAPIYCDIHSKMRAHVVVLSNPFWALIEEKGGDFQIKGVPAGSYTLTAFHPTLKVEPIKVTVGGEKSRGLVLKMIGEK